MIRFFGYYVSEQYERSTVSCTSSRAQEKYSSDRDSARPVVVGHGSQSMMGLSIDSSSVAMNLRIVRIWKSKKNFQLQELEITKMEVSPFLVV